MGEDSYLEKKIFKISNVLSTRVLGAEKIHKQTNKKELKQSIVLKIVLSFIFIHYITFAKEINIGSFVEIVSLHKLGSMCLPQHQMFGAYCTVTKVKRF